MPVPKSVLESVQEPRESFIDALCYCEIFKKFHCFEPDPRASKFEEILKESFFAMENLREKYWIWDQFKRVDVEECLTGIGKKISDWVERDFPEEASQIAMPLFDLSPEDQQSERIFAPQLIKRVEELWTKTLEAIGRPLSCVIVDPKFQLQYRDSVTGQMRREAPHRMDCLHYAFYKLREENVKNVLLKESLVQFSAIPRVVLRRFCVLSVTKWSLDRKKTISSSTSTKTCGSFMQPSWSILMSSL